MVTLKEEIKNELADAYDIPADGLSYLAGGREDSDGIVYTYIKDNKKYVLKITALHEGDDINRVVKRLEFAAYLGENGIRAAYPKKNQKGDIFQRVADGKTVFLASVMDFVEGSSPKVAELTPELIKEWGKLTGKSHKASTNYKVWKSISEEDTTYGHEREMDSMYYECRNETVKKCWLDLKQQLSLLPISRDSYGLIHNDNHQFNIIVSKNQVPEITLLDFDCAECQFFIQDLFTPIQGSLFEVIGGINYPIKDMDKIKRFYASFLDGYEVFHHLDDIWLTKMELMLNYRRLLLYTVMQNWMENDKAAGDSFLSMIKEPCRFNII